MILTNHFTRCFSVIDLSASNAVDKLKDIAKSLLKEDKPDDGKFI